MQSQVSICATSFIVENAATAADDNFEMQIFQSSLKKVISFGGTYSQRIPTELWTRLAAVANVRRAFNALVLAILRYNRVQVQDTTSLI